MAVERIVIESRSAYAEGAEFGPVGAYERLGGTIHFAVDPMQEANERIVDLDKAPRDEHGRVRFMADFALLQPSAAGRGDRRLLFHVVNRGRQVVPFNRATSEPVPTANLDPGDGFLMRRGWTVAWCGWQWDVIRGGALCGLEAPTARHVGEPVSGQVSVAFQPNAQTPYYKLDHWSLSPPPDVPHFRHRPYPASDVNDPEATLTVRDSQDAPRTVIPRNRWRFALDEGGQPVAHDSFVWLEGGFEAGRLYEVIYHTRHCPVVGTGLLAIRDCVSFLRGASAADGNPCESRLDYAYGYGVSQCGRLLRAFLHLGLNIDEEGRQVFDGVMPMVAGARRGEFNHRFAQPSVQHTLSFGHRPPFADDEQTDPITGQRDGLLSRQRALGGLPRIFTINTSSEYWRSDCSLIHTDLSGVRDLQPPPEVRVYMLAGAQHGPGALPLHDTAPSGARGGNWFNVVDYSPLVRAALVNLDRWVSKGVEPPPSMVPLLADGTAVPRERVLDAFRRFPTAALLRGETLPTLRRIDLGPEAGQGVGRYPAATGEPFPSFVSAVDADGNETAGIGLPDLTVPVGTHTGWNPRHPETGGTGQNVDMQGSTLPFAATREERERTGDPRLSIAERYRDRDDYVARARKEARRLAAERFVLEEDVELVVALAAERYDVLARANAGKP